MGLGPELDKIRQEIDACTSDAQRLAAGLTEEQLAWRPDPGRWSVAEIFVHLNLATQTYAPSIVRTIEEARRKQLFGGGPFGFGFVGRLFISSLEPPVRMKTRAPKLIRPLLQGPARDALPHFLRSQQIVLKLLEEANGLDLRRVTFVSPFSALLRTNLLAPFGIITAHQRRHLWQGWNVRKQLEMKSAQSA